MLLWATSWYNESARETQEGANLPVYLIDQNTHFEWGPVLDTLYQGKENNYKRPS